MAEKFTVNIFFGNKLEQGTQHIFLSEPQLCRTITLGNGNVWYSNRYANGGYAVGTVAMFSCKEGYIAYGQSRICVIDRFLFAHWSPKSFGCTKGNNM